MAKNCRQGRDANRPAKRSERLQAEAVAEILGAAGLPFTYERTKHLAIMVCGKRITLACTPRNEGDSITYVRQQARRVIRELALDASPERS